MDQIQFLLGHVSVQTTERYLGCKQRIRGAVKDCIGIEPSGGSRINPAYLSWTPEQAIVAMDKQGVATAVLSLSTPGVWCEDPKTAAQTARTPTKMRGKSRAKVLPKTLVPALLPKL